MRGYDWQSIAAKLGYKTEEEMLNDLYWEKSLKPREIVEIVSGHIDGIYAISEQTVHSRLSRYGIERRGQGGYNGRGILWPEHWEKVKKLDYENMTAREICDATGIEPFQFYNLRRRVGGFKHLRARL